MKAGLATIALRRYDVFDALDLAAEAGFQGVEIWGKPPHMPEGIDEDHIRAIRDRARANGVEIAMYGSYTRPMLPGFDEATDRAIEIARLLGTRIIRMWAGNKEPHEADEETWATVSTRLHEFALKAEFHGMLLAMEMHGGTLCATPEGAMRVIEEAKAPNLKINFQVVDPARPDLERAIGMVGEHVVNVHAQNYRQSPLEPEKMELTLIEEGLVDYDRVLKLLHDHGFDGFVEVEFLKDEHVSQTAMLESLKRDSAYLRALTAKYSP